MESAPATLSIMGPITNPAWYVSVNNDVVASGAVTAEIPNGDKLVVNSKDGYLEVAEYTVSSNEFVRNLYQFTDFDRETFVLFPPGNSTLPSSFMWGLLVLNMLSLIMCCAFIMMGVVYVFFILLLLLSFD